MFGSVALAPEPARPGLVDKVADLFDAAPERIFFGTDYPAAMGTLDELHRQVAGSPVAAPHTGAMATNASRFVSEALATIDRALELGCNLLDTAEMYLTIDR